MRVLHVYSGNLFGGVESFLLSLARHSRHANDHHEFALCFEARLARELRDQQTPVHLLGAARMSRPWTILRARRSLARLLQREKFDCVICHAPWSAAVFGAVLRRQRLALILYLHGHVAGKHWTDRWAARSAPDLIVAVSESVASSGRAVFAGAECHVLHNPLSRPIDAFNGAMRNALRSAMGVKPEDALIILVSRMDPVKGHSQSLAALAKIAGCAHWRCWIVGGAQRPDEVAYMATIEQTVQATGIADRVQFLGERNDVPDLLASADIFLQANAGPEGFSIVFMEALAAKLPVITMRLGGAPELIDETCGVLLEPGDVNGVAKALARLIAEPDLRRRLGEAGHQRVLDRCDPFVHLACLMGILREHLNSARSEVGYRTGAA